MKTKLAYCHFKGHPGWMSLEKIRQKKCREKHCRYLEINPEHPFWKQKEQIKDFQRIEKEILKSSKELFNDAANILLCKHIEGSLYVLFVGDTMIEYRHLYDLLGAKGINDIKIRIVTVYNPPQHFDILWKNYLPKNLK